MNANLLFLVGGRSENHKIVESLVGEQQSSISKIRFNQIRQQILGSMFAFPTEISWAFTVGAFRV